MILPNHNSETFAKKFIEHIKYITTIITDCNACYPHDVSAVNGNHVIVSDSKFFQKFGSFPYE